MISFLTAATDTSNNIACLIIDDSHGSLLGIEIIIAATILPSIHHIADNPLQLIV